MNIDLLEFSFELIQLPIELLTENLISPLQSFDLEDLARGRLPCLVMLLARVLGVRSFRFSVCFPQRGSGRRRPHGRDPF